MSHSNPSGKGKALRLSVVVVSLLCLALFRAGPAHASTIFTVNLTVDTAESILNVGDGRCDVNVFVVGNQCTLRAAIQEVDAGSGADTIGFNVGGGGVQTITLGSSLPTITKQVTINGKTQPNCTAYPCIVVKGPGTVDADGFVVAAANSTIEGLVINNFVSVSPYAHGHAILLQANGAIVEGNYVGTNVNGTAAVANFKGIEISSSNNTIGGTTAGARNLISGNSIAGVEIAGNGATGNLIEGNYIGTDANGTTVIPNTYGIDISSPSNTVGGTTPGTRNLISGNFSDGVLIEGNGTTGNLVEGNYIGTDVNGSAALPNGAGAEISEASDNTIGGTAAGAGNLISGNSIDGVVIGYDATENLVEGNFIGTDVNGTGALGNAQQGVYVNSASNNTIGGTTAGARNLISGNSEAGVDIEGSASMTNTVQGNFIGTDITGSLALGNGTGGVAIYDASSNLIGGSTTPAHNIISGNGGHGVSIVSLNTAAANNTVQGNFIGLNADGTGALGNEINGVNVNGPNNVIGGADAGARNIVSANGRGIYLYGSNATGNLVQGNFIGTDLSGTLARGNDSVGMRLEDAANNNVIRNNVISANKDTGIEIPNSNDNVIQGNFIGLHADGKGKLGNAGDGIALEGSSSNNILGGTGSGESNRVANNAGNGITIGTLLNDTTTANAIQRNAIFSNAKLGIDLGDDGRTPNDAGDSDSGPNNLQNYPILTTATGATKVVTGKLKSTPKTKFTLEFFATKACDPSHFGEGKKFLGAKQVKTNGTGNASFTFTTIKGFKAGQPITATATDAAGNTSEFSKCVKAT